METIIFDKDIKVLYLTASSFPEGILDAHQKLRAIVPFSEKRKYYGISRPEHDTIVYRAAAEEMVNGEAKKLNCETLILKKGNYLSLTIKDFMQNIPGIGKAFTELLTHPDIDPEGYCVEWYFTETDVKCMIRLMH